MTGNSCHIDKVRGAEMPVDDRHEVLTLAFGPIFDEVQRLYPTGDYLPPLRGHCVCAGWYIESLRNIFFLSIYFLY